ncbi:hypothetical protein MASR1M90_04980 [Desulfovibrionales bacterium]
MYFHSSGRALRPEQTMRTAWRMRTTCPDCIGFCRTCGHEHRLSAAPALDAARALLAELKHHSSIGLGQSPDPRLDLNYLYGPARGQMFGVVVARDAHGRECVCKAFSGQYNGLWMVPGWVPPIVDPAAFAQTICHDEPRIKALTRALDAMAADDPSRPALVRQRRELSQNLMQRIFDLYALTNFHGQTKPMRDVCAGQTIPTGTGECCAPKLLHYAATHGLTPMGLVEFYVGRENRSGSRQHGQFSAPCAEKCGPILGFLLCGLQA